MGADVRRRAEEIDQIVTLLDSVGSEYLDWKGQLFPIATKVYEREQEQVAQAVQAERERCAQAAWDYSQVTNRYTSRMLSSRTVADGLAAALRARPAEPTGEQG